MIARTARRRPPVAQGLALVLPSLLLVMFATLAALPAEADEGEGKVEETPFAQSGVYVGVAGGVAIEGARDSTVDDSYAVGGWIGYRALPLLSVELQIEHTTEDDLKRDSGGLESIVWTANSRLFFGTARVQPFALVGLGMSIGLEKQKTKVGNNADVAVRAGLGLQTHITDGLSVVLSGSYLGSFRANRHLDYGSATVGLQYQF